MLKDKPQSLPARPSDVVRLRHLPLSTGVRPASRIGRWWLWLVAMGLVGTVCWFCYWLNLSCRCRPGSLLWLI